MQSCLGLYIDEGIIKYAKVIKDRKGYKVESYGVKFSDDVMKTIHQIVSETNSFNVPVSVNLSRVKYKYSSVPDLLKPKELERAINTEFEYFCDSNNKDIDEIEYKYVVNYNDWSEDEREELNVIFAYVDKEEITNTVNILNDYTVGDAMPIATAIPIINNYGNNETCAYINIENKTEIITVAGGIIQRIDKLEHGMDSILKKIGYKEDLYGLCRNATLFTRRTQNIRIEGNDFLDEINDGMADIADEAKTVINYNEVKIDNIYITGTGSIINNIDGFFQENFIGKTVEILVPYFIDVVNTKVNIQDYTEVNSAIALAMQTIEGDESDFSFYHQEKKKYNIFRSIKWR